MAGTFDGKVVVITGAGGGIGKEYALYFAKEGAKVVVNDLGSDRHGGGKGAELAGAVVEEIKAAGGDAVANFDSVATREGADGIMWSALAKYGKLDVLINNAGILRDRTLVNMSDHDWDLIMDVHLKGTYLCSQAAARIFKVQKSGGRIINTTSLAGLLGNFGQCNYGAAKAGIYGFTRVASLELVKMGVTVNAIAPVALTRLTEDIALFKGVSREEMGPQFIVPVAAFLASDLASDITGQTIGVQAGRIFVYKMAQSGGVTKDSARGAWTIAEIKEKWDEICKNPEPAF
jgi:NAD(P)-dependent dehydrogenase (short-subunit alcohol dehydrogenase family)